MYYKVYVYTYQRHCLQVVVVLILHPFFPEAGLKIYTKALSQKFRCGVVSCSRVEESKPNLPNFADCVADLGYAPLKLQTADVSTTQKPVFLPVFESGESMCLHAHTAATVHYICSVIIQRPQLPISAHPRSR